MSPTASPKETTKPVQAIAPGWLRPLAAFLVNVFAVIFFLVSILGPLLPSYGLPSARLLALCVGGPCLLLLTSASLCRSTAARLICSLEIIGALGITHHLYSMLIEMQKHGFSPDR
jgi:hypothetical protein